MTRNKFTRSDIRYYNPHGTKNWIVDTQFAFRSYLIGILIVISRGFCTDFASTGRIGRAFLDDDDSRIRDAAVIHDWLYQHQPAWCSRLTADRILIEAMEELGAQWYWRTVVFSFVRSFGWLVWRRYRKSKIESRHHA